ncbi:MULTISPECIES: hypothetical protein [Pelosinus]|uniref:Flp/Fap pilin component n=1 Tax=Pelosinus fermentans B4 TaxID=1149862 RepID=I9LIU2_9FIRM|nr:MULTISPECIES: hypothetical protein [Pelosinus]EIW20449.1 hypothetical protein FB4_2067 [Pelosinus fermentans B4]EIW25836.1 hypothetical protein FA11_2459 [Pelosinus fermentans A11]OAM93560.1 hypothetical protein FR7_01577 [Pelosinus fermentans DSM 17108]SDQ82075.1 pilus assembly protein Flp/PilA [Pelosinus fermentans]
MLTYLKHLKIHYLNEKGQGMVEYAVVVAVVIAIGVALLGDGGAGTITETVTNLYTTVFGRAANIGQ